MARPLFSVLALAFTISAACTAYAQSPSDAQKPPEAPADFVQQIRKSKSLVELQDHITRLKGDPQIQDLMRRRDLMMYEDSRSKIGFMKYCGEKHLTDAATSRESADIYTKYVALIFYSMLGSSRTYDREAGDEAERQGNSGFFYYKNWQSALPFADPLDNPSGKSLDEYAKMTKQTPAGICQQWASEATARAPSLADVEAGLKAFEKVVPSGSEQKR